MYCFLSTYILVHSSTAGNPNPHPQEQNNGTLAPTMEENNSFCVAFDHIIAVKSMDPSIDCFNNLDIPQEADFYKDSECVLGFNLAMLFGKL